MLSDWRAIDYVGIDWNGTVVQMFVFIHASIFKYSCLLPYFFRTIRKLATALESRSVSLTLSKWYCPNSLGIRVDL